MFVLGAARAFEAPTLQALLPRLVPLPILPRAVAGSASANQTATIAGPAIGGLLYVLSPTLVYAICCALFLAAGMLISMIRVERVAPKREKIDLERLFAGIAYIRKKPIILGATSLDMFAVLLGGATALLPIYAKDILMTGPWGLGLLRASPAVGALLMAVALARWPLRQHAGRKMFAAVAVFGVATIVFAVSTSLALSIARLVRRRRRRHGERGGAADPRTGADTGRHARPRHLGQRAVCRHLEPARRIPRRRARASRRHRCPRC